MALTNIKVAQLACTEVGLEPVATMNDDSTEGRVIALHYDMIKGVVFGNHYWRFATGQVVLSRLSPDPAGRYSYAFQIPANVKRIRAVTVNGFPIEFERYSDAIYCDADGTINVVLDGVFDVVEALWPDFFARVVVLKLAAVLASGVREDAAMRKQLEDEAAVELRMCKSLDSQGRTTSRLRPTRITNARLRRSGV